MRQLSIATIKGFELRPKNYRAHDFHILGEDISIGGMAGLHHNYNMNTALRYLKDTEKRVVLIGMHEKFNFTAVANRHRIEYYHVPVGDLLNTPIHPEIYDVIYGVVKKATTKGKRVTISCGAGDGRTGTALASLKLRELLEKTAKENPLILAESPGKTEMVKIPIGTEESLPNIVPCTPFVKAAVEGVRNQRSAPDDSGLNSVETSNDIATLIAYEVHLRRVITAEIKAKKAKANACKNLLQQIKALVTIGDNDVAMDEYISDQLCAIDSADDLDKKSKIHDELMTTLIRIERDTSVQKIKEKIEALRKKTGPNSAAKKLKAELIERAICRVPVIHRHDLMTAETEEAINLRRAVGSQRFWSRVQRIGSVITNLFKNGLLQPQSETQDSPPRSTNIRNSATKASLLLAGDPSTAARQLATTISRDGFPTLKTIRPLATIPESPEEAEHTIVSFHEEGRGYISYV